MAGLEHQHLVAGRQRVDQRRFPGAGARGGIDHHRAGGLEDALHAGEHRSCPARGIPGRDGRWSAGRWRAGCGPARWSGPGICRKWRPGVRLRLGVAVLMMASRSRCRSAGVDAGDCRRRDLKRVRDGLSRCRCAGWLQTQMGPTNRSGPILDARNRPPAQACQRQWLQSWSRRLVISSISARRTLRRPAWAAMSISISCRRMPSRWHCAWRASGYGKRSFLHCSALADAAPSASHACGCDQ